MRKEYLYLIKKQLAKGRIFWFPVQAAKYVSVPLSRKIGHPLAGPINGSFFVTYRCNNDCIMCDYPQRASQFKSDGKQEPETEEMLNIVNEFADAGTTGLGFTGGEPLLRKDIFTLLNQSVVRGMITNINTNGYLLTSDNAERILETGLDSINISIDGPNAEIHNKLRKTTQGFERAIKGITNLISLRNRMNSPLLINMVTVMSIDNIDKISEVTALAKKLNVDGLGFMPIHDYNFGKDNGLFSEQKEKTLQKVEAVIDGLIENKKKYKIDNSDQYLKLFKGCFSGKDNPLTCYAPYTHLMVDCYRNTFPCWHWVETGKTSGNIMGQSIKEFWKSNEFNKARRELLHCHACYWNCHTEMNVLFNR